MLWLQRFGERRGSKFAELRRDSVVKAHIDKPQALYYHSRNSLSLVRSFTAQRPLLRTPLYAPSSRCNVREGYQQRNSSYHSVPPLKADLPLMTPHCPLSQCCLFGRYPRNPRAWRQRSHSSALSARIGSAVSRCCPLALESAGHAEDAYPSLRLFLNAASFCDAGERMLSEGEM